MSVCCLKDKVFFLVQFKGLEEVVSSTRLEAGGSMFDVFGMKIEEELFGRIQRMKKNTSMKMTSRKRNSK